MSLDTASGVATQSSITQSHNHTIRHVINGANQIQCIDADASGACDGSETVWEYDAYGGLLTDGSTQYTYDAANRLASITAAGVTTTYKYNGDGDRISQTVGTVTTTYVLDTATPLTMVLSETTGGETTRYWHALDTLAQSDGTTTEYFGYDGLGSVRQLVDETGSVGLAQTFDPYGSGYATSGSASSSLGYTGEQTDSNGFVYLRARYYNPAYGRFFQRDTWEGDNQRPQSLNAYMYVEGRVLIFVDPSGKAPIGVPYQPTGNVTEPPVYMDRAPSNVVPLWLYPGEEKKLEFAPGYTYVLPPFREDGTVPDSQFVRSSGNLCGTVSVAAIARTLLRRNAPSLDDFVDKLDEEHDITATQGFDTLEYLADWAGLSHWFYKRPEFEVSTSEQFRERYATRLRQQLAVKRLPIVFIGFNDSGPVNEAGNTYQLANYTGDNGHFVVITGLSEKTFWKKGAEWKWVRVFNPFNMAGGAEYYIAQKFFDMQDDYFQTLFLYHEAYE